MTDLAREQVAPATTTAEEHRVSVGQRRINMWWEGTLAATVLLSVVTMMFLFVRDGEIPANLFVFTTAVYTGYATRANHTTIGGVGPKPPTPPYEGR